MDAITLLKSDHKKVSDLFEKVDSLSDTAHATRGKLFAEISSELTMHAKIEEQVFYPAFQAKTKQNTDPGDEVREAYEEHANVKEMLAKLEALEPNDDTYNAKLQVLGDLVKHHVKGEESELFKQAKQLLDNDELEALGKQMTSLKAKLASR